MQRPAVARGLDRGDKGRMPASAAPGPSAGALAADLGVVDLDARAGGAKPVTPVALEHGLHQLVLHPPGSPGRDPEPPAQLDAGQALLALGEQVLRVTSVKLV